VPEPILNVDKKKQMTFKLAQLCG